LFLIVDLLKIINIYQLVDLMLVVVTKILFESGMVDI